MILKSNYLEGAKERIPNIPLLVNVISRRVRQLNLNERPLVKPDYREMPPVDIALKEVAEGKLTAEMAFIHMDGEDLDEPFSLDED
ncbi:MAG: DNA-directed RNA polymerase subunit omega [Spartobacteria bacterium]|nr:DNA-directed RNA polymerase subunit omega [Spartobacteria bacterium]